MLGGIHPLINSFNDNELVLSVLGGCIYYLQFVTNLSFVSDNLQLNIADELLSQRNFRELSRHSTSGTSLVLDGACLRNLGILENEKTGSLDGSLLKLMDHCVTPFGRN